MSTKPVMTNTMPTLENNRSIWKYIGMTAAVAAVCLICWYFRSILVYIAIAVVISLIGRPIKRHLCRIRFGRHPFPSWLATLLTVFLILGVILGFSMLLSPLASKITQEISTVNLDSLDYPLANFNSWVRSVFPNVGPDFKIEAVVLTQVQDLISVGTVSTVVSSVSVFLADLAVGIFSVAFMSYFFIAEEGILTNTLVSVAPDSYGEKIKHASSRTAKLLSRYFIGLIIESSCIMLLNGLGLTFIAKMHVSTAVCVAILTGIMNIVPYIGPLAGEVLAVMMGLVTHSSCTFTGSFGFFLLVVLAVCLTTQLIDNYVFQPVIYSNSVKAHPLEIFIVLLVAAKIWGVAGMIVAIPGYTVLRVILAELFPQAKIVKLLTQKMQK